MINSLSAPVAGLSHIDVKSTPMPGIRALYKDGILPWDCPLPECEAPKKCHGQVGIGVCTLGTCCSFPEGHGDEHSYGGIGCNKHKVCSTGEAH